MQLPDSLATLNGLDSLAWLLLGACSQSILTLFLPTYVSFLPIATLLAVKASRLALTDKSSTSPTAKALKGRYTAQIPHEDGSATQQGADTEVVVFVIGACSSHPQGLEAPGFQELGGHWQGMWTAVEADRQNWGYLGKSSALQGTVSETKNAMIVLSYWKNVESLRAFAQGPAHRAGWDWWIRNAKQHPHLGIMHEVYAAPRGHWENIYVNFPPFGMGQTQFLGPQGKDDLRSPLVQAKGWQARSMLSRMGREDTHEVYAG